jgi:hypothetical protein
VTVAPSPALPPPTPASGRLVLNAADSRKEIVVPPHTVVEVRLDPVDGSQWTVPESSDPHALSRLSASGGCDIARVAIFRADATGQITATRPTGDAVMVFKVTIRVAD